MKCYLKQYLLLFSLSIAPSSVISHGQFSTDFIRSDILNRMQSSYKRAKVILEVEFNLDDKSVVNHRHQKSNTETKNHSSKSFVYQSSLEKPAFIVKRVIRGEFNKSIFRPENIPIYQRDKKSQTLIKSKENTYEFYEKKYYELEKEYMEKVQRKLDEFGSIADKANGLFSEEFAFLRNKFEENINKGMSEKKASDLYNEEFNKLFNSKKLLDARSDAIHAHKHSIEHVLLEYNEKSKVLTAEFLSQLDENSMEIFVVADAVNYSFYFDVPIKKGDRYYLFIHTDIYAWEESFIIGTNPFDIYPISRYKSTFERINNKKQ